jgi:hypothetical protein
MRKLRFFALNQISSMSDLFERFCFYTKLSCNNQFFMAYSHMANFLCYFEYLESRRSQKYPFWNFSFWQNWFTKNETTSSKRIMGVDRLDCSLILELNALTLQIPAESEFCIFYIWVNVNIFKQIIKFLINFLHNIIGFPF